MKTRILSILALLLMVVTGAVAQSYNVTVKDGTEDADKWSATLNPATAGQTVTIKYNGTKTVKSIKAVKKVPTLATALENGATVTVDYIWNHYNHTYFNFTNNNGTYTCSISGDSSGDFGGSLTKSGNTLVFAATNSLMPDEINVTINFNTTYNNYQITQSGSFYVGFAISVNGTDITSQLTAQDAEEVAVTKTANNNEWTLTMPASDVELQVEYYATTPFDLTLATGSDAHGTVTFTVGGETVNQACYNDVVTVSVTPAEGYSAKDVTVRAYTGWVSAGARGMRRAIELKDYITVTKNKEDGTWSFTMPESKVWVEVTYTKNLQDAWIQAIADQTYTGSAIEPTIEVKDGETTLTLNTDYTVAYSNNVEPGTATVTVTGTGNYSGTATATFIIRADKTALNDAITEAETYHNSIKDDHADAAKDLKTAIDAAKAVNGNADATQTDVNNALSALTTAKTTAKDAVLTETKTALNNDITAAEAYYESIKDGHNTAANTLKEAIDAAKGVQKDADATQSEVDAAIAALAAAKTTAEQNVLTEAKTALNNAITEAEAYYSNISESNLKATDLQNAISNAQAVKDNASATQTEIETAAETLTDALDAAKADDALKRIAVTIPAKSYVTRIDADKRQIETAVEGVSLYTVTGVTDKQVTLSAALNVVATEMPYLIYNDNDEEKTINLIVSSSDADNVTVAAEFKGTLVDKTFTDEDMEEADHYVLSNGHNFVWVKDAGTLAGGKCWIELTKAAGARRLSIVAGGEATGIDLAPVLTEDEGAWYDLNGRRVVKPTKKGLYIKNGKKYVVK